MSPLRETNRTQPGGDIGILAHGDDPHALARANRRKPSFVGSGGVRFDAGTTGERERVGHAGRASESDFQVLALAGTSCNLTGVDPERLADGPGDAPALFGRDIDPVGG